MKAAKVIARRRTRDGGVVLHVVCPVCDRRHWVPAADIGYCSRRPGEFNLGSRK